MTALLWVLTACTGSTASFRAEIDTGALVGPPAELTRDCRGPMLLPSGRVLTQAEVETFWLRDRVALSDCRRLKAELQRFYEERDTGIRLQEREG